MATLGAEQTLSVRDVEGGWDLSVGQDDRGRIRGSRVGLDDLDLVVQRTGQRFELVTGSGTPVLRFDPAGRKATTMALSSARFRLARQRWRPLLESWVLTRDVHGAELLFVSRTPLGTKVRTADEVDLPGHELALLALGALVEVLGVEPAAVAA